MRRNNKLYGESYYSNRSSKYISVFSIEDKSELNFTSVTPVGGFTILGILIVATFGLIYFMVK